MEPYQPNLFENKVFDKVYVTQIKELKSDISTIDYLKSLTRTKEYSKIKELLQNDSQYTKGQLFEEYLRFLFEGNGFRVAKTGGKSDLGADLVILDHDDISKPSILIQAKNHNKPLDYDQTRIELTKFEEKARAKWKCHHFEIVSISGFVQQDQSLKRYITLC